MTVHHSCFGVPHPLGSEKGGGDDDEIIGTEEGEFREYKKTVIRLLLAKGMIV
jgi:hypothetical protein